MTDDRWISVDEVDKLTTRRLQRLRLWQLVKSQESGTENTTHSYICCSLHLNIEPCLVSWWYPVRAAGRSALCLLAADLRHVDAAQQVVPLGASLLGAADVGQADLGSGLRREGQDDRST